MTEQQTRARQFEISVAGITFEGRQAKLAVLHRMQAAGQTMTAALVREPDNRFDPLAVMVLMGAAGGAAQHIGYVPRALAARLAARMDAGQQVRAVEAHVLFRSDPSKIGYGVKVFAEIDEGKEAV